MPTGGHVHDHPLTQQNGAVPTSVSLHPGDIDPLWRELVAVGLVAQDVTVSGIARYGRVHAAVAERAIEGCRTAGIIASDGSVDPVTAAELVADLPIERVASVHAAVARHLMTGGPDQLVAALHHARAAGTLVPLDELVFMAERGGRLSLSLHDYASAYELLSVAVEFGSPGDHGANGRRLCDLAAAADGLGRVGEARDLLARAAVLGELADDPALVVRAAVQYAQPVDWYAGDPRATALLQRAEELAGTEGQRVAVAAARALAEMRIPVIAGDLDQQLAWVTRPGVAYRVADEALAASATCDLEVRGLALLAWRATHRAPRFLEQRLAASTEALDAAQRLRHPSNQVESAVWLAVDALENGDRSLYDEALSVARWVAERDGNPRLKWRAYCMAAGAALLDGDLESAGRFRLQARELGQQIASPGWLAADLLLMGEELVARDDPGEMVRYLLDDDAAEMISPIGRALMGHLHARCGHAELADRFVRLALRRLDEESSYLLLCSRAAAAVAAAELEQLAAELVPLLEPWVDRIVLDANGWWCDGPVALWLAELHLVTGNQAPVRNLVDLGEQRAHAINDVRSLRRAAALRGRLASASPRRHVVAGPEAAPDPADPLSAREREVLRHLAAGRTNREIAATMSFSVSTVRAATMAIYRKLEANGRTDAVARALQLGLLEPVP
jgi:DNA-binding CsgD family transcriptional regulator